MAATPRTSSRPLALPEVATACANLLGEGPVWVPAEGALYWVDIKAPAIWRMCWPEGEVTRWVPPCRISALVPCASGGFVAVSDTGFGWLDPAAGTFIPIVDPEAHLPGNRFNDGKVDPSGAFWAGSMDDAEAATSGALYRLSSALHIERIDEGYGVTNGPAFSPDGRWLYHTDSACRRVYRFGLAADGAVGPREDFLSFAETDGHPDGMTVDREGCLWIAFWDGWCVRRFAPDGTPLDRIEVPVQRPTSVAFGGPALDRLFITSARIGLSDEALAAQPLAGALFVAAPGVIGLPPIPFAA